MNTKPKGFNFIKKANLIQLNTIKNQQNQTLIHHAYGVPDLWVMAHCYKDYNPNGLEENNIAQKQYNINKTPIGNIKRKKQSL